MSSANLKAELDLLVVDDDQETRSDLVSLFRRRGHRVADCGSGEEALEVVKQQSFDVAIVDMIMPGLSGLELLKLLKQSGSECEIIMLTGEGTVESAVEAMKLGAREYLTKPISIAELERLVRKAHETGQLRKQNEQLKAALKRHQKSPAIVGQSPAMQEVFRMIDRLGPTDKPVLIQGESGTGKELVARALHQSSKLAENPLVVINCAALPATLLESELFGHEKGAFTGAAAAKPGLFEVADGGTLFIDEIGELAGELQAKLLRVLEDGSLRRLGSVRERRVHVRLLAATNRDLGQEVMAGRFREDLYYRINVLTVTLPPLRQRRGDLQLLVNHFASDEWQIDDDVMPLLERYQWPGNVRQLQNAIERAKVLADDDSISIRNLPPEVVGTLSGSPASAPPAADIDLESLVRMHVEATYRRHQKNKAKTARSLGIGRRTLYRLIEKYGIEPNPMADMR